MPITDNDMDRLESAVHSMLLENARLHLANDKILKALERMIHNSCCSTSKKPDCECSWCNAVNTVKAFATAKE